MTVTLLPLVDPATAPEPSRALLAAVQSSLGVTPNMTKAMANSPALLRGYLDLSGALAKGRLGAAVREQLALVVAQDNACGYCLSAHTYLAENAAGMDPEEIAAARKGDARDSKTASLLQFALAVNQNRGAVSEADVSRVQAAGATAEEIAEVIGHVALNVLTNYLNKAAGVEIDFPEVEV